MNVEKCKIISFSRLRDKIQFNYTINGVTIERVEKINDLGVFFNEKFNFNDDSTFRKTMMGFIRQQIKELNDKEVLKSFLLFQFLRLNLQS